MPKSNWITTTLAAATLPFFVLTAPLMAQTAAETQSEEAQGTDDGLAMGEPVNETPKPGDTYISENIGDWAVRCVVVQDQDDRCQLYQLLEDQNGQPIAEFTLLKLPEGSTARAAATIVVPLETSLRDELSIKVDDQTGKRYPFAFCNTVGCFSRIGLTQEDIDVYKRGTEAVMTIIPMAAPDARVSVAVSLKGFTAAFDALTLAGAQGE